MSKGQAFVDELLQKHKVVVISKSYCPFCVKAKNVLAKYTIDDIVIEEIEDRDDMNEIQDYCKKITGVCGEGLGLAVSTLTRSTPFSRVRLMNIWLT